MTIQHYDTALKTFTSWTLFTSLKLRRNIHLELLFHNSQLNLITTIQDNSSIYRSGFWPGVLLNTCVVACKGLTGFALSSLHTVSRITCTRSSWLVCRKILPVTNEDFLNKNNHSWVSRECSYISCVECKKSVFGVDFTYLSLWSCY